VILSSGNPPSAAPQPITAANPPPRRPAHQSHITIGHSTSMPITANDHNQDTSTRWFSAVNNPQQRSHNMSLSSVPNQCYKPSAPTAAPQQHQQPQRHQPQCPHLQQRQRINKPPSSSDTTAPSLAPPGPSRITKPRFVRHRRQQRQQFTGAKEARKQKLVK
jgi:hypothetical protein